MRETERMLGISAKRNLSVWSPVIGWARSHLKMSNVHHHRHHQQFRHLHALQMQARHEI